jgi:hypothetical protein
MRTGAAAAFEARRLLENVGLAPQSPKVGERPVEIMTIGIVRGGGRPHNRRAGRSSRTVRHTGMASTKSRLPPKASVCVVVRSANGHRSMPVGSSGLVKEEGASCHLLGSAAFSSITATPETAVATIRDGASSETGDNLDCGITTVVGAVVSTGKVQGGDNIVVSGLVAMLRRVTACPGRIRSLA